MKPTKNKSNKGMFPYTNLIKCGNCGCYLTAEIKKDKYIYYHCTEKKGTCKQPYIKQEVVEAEFEKLVEPYTNLGTSVTCPGVVHLRKLEEYLP